MANDKLINLWAARIIPIIILGILAYVSYVLLKLVCIDWIVQHQHRHGTSAALISVYSILLALFVLYYFRLIGAISINPGFVLKGEVSLEQFSRRDAYICDHRGLPIWCRTCKTWKPDRTHHCREVECCVRRMDHFCPWVGGIVSETTMKFFTQFVTVAAFFTTYILVVMAYFLHERKRVINDIDGQWIAVLAIAGVFCLFSSVMAGRFIFFALRNTTTIEDLDKVKTYHVAVSIVADPTVAADSHSPFPFNTITYSRNPAIPPLIEPPPRLEEYPPDYGIQPESRLTMASDNIAFQYRDGRTFAVLQTKPGDNLWSLSPYRNWKSMMGNNVLDWILPVKHSPHCKHDRVDGEFEFGPTLERVKRDAGLQSKASRNGSSVLSNRRRRRSSHSRHHPEEQEMGELTERRAEKKRKHKKRRNKLAERALLA